MPIAAPAPTPAVFNEAFLLPEQFCFENLLCFILESVELEIS